MGSALSNSHGCMVDRRFIHFSLDNQQYKTTGYCRKPMKTPKRTSNTWWRPSRTLDRLTAAAHVTATKHQVEPGLNLEMKKQHSATALVVCPEGKEYLSTETDPNISLSL